jgi:hypothetical protein
MSGWTIENDCAPGVCSTPLVGYRSDYDYESCAGSGSVLLYYYGFYFPALVQCIPAEAGKSYRFGFSYRQMSPDPDAVRCRLESYSGSTCSGSSLSNLSVDSGAVPYSTWSTTSATFAAPGSTGSIKVSCQTGSIYEAWVDQVYLNGSGGYF